MSPKLVERSYPAIILPAQQAELLFKVSGRVIELPIRASTKVEKGQIIAQLDRQDYEAAVVQLESQLDQANAQLTALKAGARKEDVAALQAKVKAAKAQLEAQNKQVSRLKELTSKGTIARADYEKEVAKLSSDKANLDVAQQELKIAQVGARTEEVEAQEAVISGLQSQLADARGNLKDTTLRAPFNGVIASRNIENYSNIQENTVVAVLHKLETLDLQFDVPGVDVATLGQKKSTTTAQLDVAPNKPYEAKLVEFGIQADAATQTYRGRVSIPYPKDVTVLPGMTGRINVAYHQKTDNQLFVGVLEILCHFSNMQKSRNDTCLNNSTLTRRWPPYAMAKT